MTFTEQDLQVHKFVKDAHDMLGTIDNVVAEHTDPRRKADAIPDVGSVREIAERLREKLLLLTR